MILIDKKENTVEKIDIFSLSQIVSRQNQSYGDQFFDSVSIVSLNELKNMLEDDLINEDEFIQASNDFEKLIGKTDKFHDFKNIVLVEIENNKTEIKVFVTNTDATPFATEKANSMLDNYDYEVEIDAVVFSDTNTLLDYFNDLDHTDKIYEEIKYFIKHKVGLKNV